MSPILGARGGLSASAYGFTSVVAPIVGDYESISTVTVGSTPATEIIFSSIPQTYKHLQIRALVRNNRAASASNTYFRFNGDTASNYAFHALLGNGSTTSAYGGTANVQLSTDPSGSFTANCFAGQIYDILDYKNTNKAKTTRILLGFDGNGSGEVHIASDLWTSTSAISSIRFFPNSGEYVQYTTFALYGIN